MNIGKMMQQAKQMQENMQKMQEELATMELTGEAGGGMVHVVVGGDRSVRRIKIDPALWEEQDKALVEDLVAAAINNAMQKVEETSKQQQQSLMSGMSLPPGFSL